MAQFRFNLQDIETGEIKPFKTLKDVSVFLDIKPHQARTFLLASEKLYLHPQS